MARRAGLHVRRITLSFLGGATAVDRRAPTLRAELRIALAGPLASFALAVAAALVHVAMVEMGSDGLAAASMAAVALANLGIAAINLLPAPPLDAGAVATLVLDRMSRGRIDATAALAHGGRALGGLSLALAVMAATSGDVFVGLWAALLGLVLLERIDEGIGGARQPLAAGHGGNAAAPAAIAPERAKPARAA
jgi:Zn-dependent protease